MKSYYQKRKCLNCDKPIADQEHAAIKYCPKAVNEEGKKISCKDQYWSAIRKEEMEPFNAIAFFQREQFRRIQQLVKSKGYLVTIKDLNRFGVDLSRPVKFTWKPNMAFEFYFHKYVIHQLPNDQFKIFTHELY